MDHLLSKEKEELDSSMVGIPITSGWVSVDRTMYLLKKFFLTKFSRGRSSVGRAPALQAGGRRFETVRLHQVSDQDKSGS